jgi:hypothetical protein
MNSILSQLTRLQERDLRRLQDEIGREVLRRREMAASGASDDTIMAFSSEAAPETPLSPLQMRVAGRLRNNNEPRRAA